MMTQFDIFGWAWTHDGPGWLSTADNFETQLWSSAIYGMLDNVNT